MVINKEKLHKIISPQFEKLVLVDLSSFGFVGKENITAFITGHLKFLVFKLDTIFNVNDLYRINVINSI